MQRNLPRQIDSRTAEAHLQVYCSFCIWSNDHLLTTDATYVKEIRMHDAQVRSHSLPE